MERMEKEKGEKLFLSKWIWKRPHVRISKSSSIFLSSTSLPFSSDDLFCCSQENRERKTMMIKNENILLIQMKLTISMMMIIVFNWSIINQTSFCFSIFMLILRVWLTYFDISRYKYICLSLIKENTCQNIGFCMEFVCQFY